MTKTQLVKILAEKTGLTAVEVEAVIDGAIALIMDSLKKGDYVQIRGFGTFKVIKRKAKKARNPRQNTVVELPDRYVPYFKPTREFKNMVIESLKDKVSEESASAKEPGEETET